MLFPFFLVLQEETAKLVGRVELDLADYATDGKQRALMLLNMIHMNISDCSFF